MTAGTTITGAGGSGNFYPRVAPNTSRQEWLVVAANNFSKTIGQRIGSASVGSGAPPPSPAPTGATNPQMVIDSPANGSTVYSSFAISGWALDLGNTAGSGVDAVHAWAFPVGSPNGIFVGASTSGVPRGDVAAAFGNARFGLAGYTIYGSLSPGAYDLTVYAHTAMTGTFNIARVVASTSFRPRRSRTWPSICRRSTSP